MKTLAELKVLDALPLWQTRTGPAATPGTTGVPINISPVGVLMITP